MPCSRRSSMSPNRPPSVDARDLVQVHPAQGGTDAGRQLLGHHRLGDVVVGAGLQPGDQVVGVGLGGDDDDRHDAVAAQLAAHVEPRQVGQAQVEQDEIRLPLLEQGQAGAAVGRLADLVPLVLEGQGEGDADGVVVLDEQQRIHVPTLAGRPGILLQKSHTGSGVPSQSRIRMTPVHAALVGYLPPPGAPPAAGTCGQLTASNATTHEATRRLRHAGTSAHRSHRSAPAPRRRVGRRAPHHRGPRRRAAGRVPAAAPHLRADRQPQRASP